MRAPLLLVAAAAAALALAAGTHAGGWATVGLASLPDGIEAGKTWTAEITVLRHGRTPTDGAKPALTIRDGKGTTRTFPARPAGRTGAYRAKVVFPHEGTWRYEIDNGLAATGYGVSATTTYAPIQVGAPAGSSFPTWPLAGSLGAAALIAAALLARRRAVRVPMPT
jgi:hypothetical protein